MEYEEIGQVNKVSFGGNEYHVVLTALHADHFGDNFGSDPLYDVKAVSALRILSQSMAILLPYKRSKYVALGLYNRKVYNTFFKLEQDRLYLLSSSMHPPKLDSVL